jgi:hypothetical protein
MPEDAKEARGMGSGKRSKSGDQFRPPEVEANMQHQ